MKIVLSNGKIVDGCGILFWATWLSRMGELPTHRAAKTSMKKAADATSSELPKAGWLQVKQAQASANANKELDKEPHPAALGRKKNSWVCLFSIFVSLI